MTEERQVDEPSRGGKRQRTKPVVGVIATETNAGDLAGTLSTVLKREYDALVTYYDGASTAVRIARTLGAEIVDPGEARTDAKSLRRELVREARRRGYPAIIFHSDVSAPIDFERTESILAESEEYAVEARTRSPDVRADARGARGDVLVAVPAFNEEGSIASVVREARAYADVVVVVDDGSWDETAARAEAVGAVVVRHEHNSGYGAALKTAFREARQRDADHLIVIDGDGQHDAEDIPQLLNVQRDSGANIVIGNRFEGERAYNIPLYRRFGLGIINSMMSISLRLLRADFRVDDAQSGFRAYDARTIRSLAADESISDGMDASLDILFHAYHQGYDIAEIGTTIRYESPETSTHRPIPHGIRLVKRVVGTVQLERPILVMGIPGVLSTLFGVSVGYWVLSTATISALSTGGLLVAFALLSVVGLLVSFAGVVLYALNVFIDGE